MVLALDEGLLPQASGVASKLRRSGRSVELVLESKKMKWAFKVRDPGCSSVVSAHHGSAVLHAACRKVQRRAARACRR